MNDATTVGDPAGFRHHAAIYASDSELLDVIVPFLQRGAAAGTPTLVGVGVRETGLLSEALADTPGVTFLPPDGYSHPLTALKNTWELLTRHVETGPVRLVGQIPAQQLGTNWHGWVRYETAVGRILAALPVQAVCAYDARDTPAAVLADVQSAHPLLATAGGHSSSNDSFGDPVQLLTDRMRGTPDPLERRTPDLDLTDPPIRAARSDVAELAERTGFSTQDIDALTLAVSEVVTNAYRHGRPSVVLRAWAETDRVIVTVTDGGSGPADPFAGLAPATGSAHDSGFGLWIAHQMCSRVDHYRHPAGYTVRLTAKATPR